MEPGAAEGGTYPSSPHDVHRDDRLHLLRAFSQDDQRPLRSHFYAVILKA